MTEMADYTYNYHDIDSGSHKRQRIGTADQQFWPGNDALSTDLTSHTAYDPVRDILNHDPIYPDTSCIDFQTINVNEWYLDPNMQIFQQPYNFQEHDTSLSNQLYCEPPTTTATLAPILQNTLNQTEKWNFTQTTVEGQEWSPLHDQVERDNQDFTIAMEVMPSPPVEPAVVCFGMVTDIPVQCYQSGSLLVDSASLPLVFVNPNSLKHASAGQEGDFGKLDDRTAKIFTNLLAENGVLIQIYSRNTPRRPGPRGKGSKKAGPRTLQSLINAIIYGPDALCQAMGDYLTKCGIFLQDPLQNDRDVVYRNPHILSRSEEIVLISELKIETSDGQSKGLENPHDLFSELSKDDHLSLTEAPSEVSTELYPHQKKALTFMVQREAAWTFEGSESDLWVKEADETGGIIYANLITGSSQSSEPPESRGGLLADKMGLGKSLTMISLIALNPAQCKEPFMFTPQGHIRRVKSTLVVVPYSLLKTWDTQLKKHLKPKTLTWTRFHGPQKKHRILIFSPYDIVITTYETLVSQQKRQRDSKYGDTLFSFAWHRIVLDEAHTIRNRGTSMAQACRAVRATSRWAMTGTPIQNRVTDFASLLEYLHIYPFSNPKTFEAEIMKPCMRLDDPDVSRMRKLVNCISLCRTKAVIDLPKREDEIHYLDLSPKEREYYDQVKHNTIKKMDEALAHNPLAPNQYLNALQWLNELRLICNHGLVHSRKVTDKAAVAMSQDQPWNHKIASKAFETLVKAGQAVCKHCGENITEGTGEAANSEFPKPSLSKCLTLICGSCIQIKVGGQKVLTCSCTPKCPKVDVSWAPEAADVRPEKSLPAMKPEEASTKLKALLECLQQSPEDEKSVVFSYWTFTLDLIEILLKDARISFARIDGKQSGDQRDASIQKFETDASIQVILVSITCGGTGLDLTAASRAYLLEPQWNPMIEEQALCRIHRMGQTKEVKTIRFRINDSFEEKIAVIQQDKKDLAAWAFSDEDRAEAADGGAARLQALRGAFR